MRFRRGRRSYGRRSFRGRRVTRRVFASRGRRRSFGGRGRALKIGYRM